MERVAGKVMLLWGWRRALAASLAGAFAALVQPPYDFMAAGFVAFPVLVWLLDGTASVPGESRLRAGLRNFAVGFWFGFGYFLAGLWWIGNALLVEADLFAWALPFAVLGLPALLALFHGIATLAARLVWSDHIGRIAALAFAFGLTEWLRGFVLTGFPWNAIGQGLMPVPVLMQSVGLVGMTGMNVLAVFLFALPALVSSDRHRTAGLIAGLAIAFAHAGYGTWRLSAADPTPPDLLRVRIVQPSILQSQKWDAAERDRIFRTYLELSGRPVADGEAPPDVIVWPETAFPFLLTQRPDALVALAELLEPDQLLLAGAVRVEGQGAAARYYNSILAIDAEGAIIDAVDKVHLVPFGEYMPLGALLSRLGVEQLVQNVSAFEAGAGRRPLSLGGGVTALPFICYEIIFPGVAGAMDTPADLVLNVTNDAWFGDTPGPYQHFRQAQLRAVEAGRPLVRAANNGISGVVDAHGRIVDAFAIDAVGVLDVTLPAERPTPPPLQPARVGWAISLCMFMLAAFFAFRLRRLAN